MSGGVLAPATPAPGAGAETGGDKPYLRRWDYMHFALAALVILIAATLIGIFAVRGDTQGMSSAAAIVSGWVGAVLGWFFTKTAGPASSSSNRPPGGGGAPPGSGGGGPPPPVGNVGGGNPAQGTPSGTTGTST